jgi:L-lactate dehydrogenase complex protein LldE
MRALFFVTCLADQFFADAAADAVRLLRALGVEVAFPAGQTCCGQPAFNAGYPDEARAMARHTLKVLEGDDPVVVPGGSCAAMLRLSYPRLFAGTAEQEAAARLARRTFELSRFVVRELGVPRLGRGLAGRRVALHCGCHALRELGIAAEPRTLLEGTGAEVVPWETAEECCGFGGVFAVKQPEVSAAMADRKLDTLPEADWLTSGDPGCLLQLAGRAAHRAPGGHPPPPMRHLASLLWEAHRDAPPETPPEVSRGG